jgi:hypothetical protein
MGRDAAGDTDLLFLDEETDLELQLAVDSEPICEFHASKNLGALMLSICPPSLRVDFGLGWFVTFAVCERADWTVVDKVSIVRCTEAAS